MFHRVKSESQDQYAPAQRTPDSRKDARPEAASFKPLQPAAAEQTVAPAAPAVPAATKNANPFSSSRTASAQAAPEESASAISTSSKDEKDTASMTEQDTTQTDQPYAEDRDLPISTYARAGSAPAVRAPVAPYAGSYSAYNARTQDSSSLVSTAAGSSDRRLTIGSGITLSGEIESCDYLLVEGTVEAALKGANVLDIAESGVFYGTVEINEATIAGRFEGDIAVNGRLTITSSGTVTGSISYKELSIEAGAVIDGKLTPMTAVQASGKKPSAGKVKSSKDRDGSEGELFGKAVAAAE
jgi:cytoskeletal protein CcmA (bactofilin family)